MATKDRLVLRRPVWARIVFPVVLLVVIGGISHMGSDGTWLSWAGTGTQAHREANEPSTVQADSPPRPDHNHPAFTERVRERRMMVDTQIKSRGVKDPNVLRAMQTVPRHAFVPADMQRFAYTDGPLPIGDGQTISQPYIVAFMTETLGLDPNSRVLEIGTGSGYQAAVCAEIAREVYTIEIVESLARTAAGRLQNLDYANVFVKMGDGHYGWPEKAPFDAVIVTAAPHDIPAPLIEQLKPTGRMILPIEDANGLQYLVLAVKDRDGRLQKKHVLPVRFVPMTGGSGKARP